MKKAYPILFFFFFNLNRYALDMIYIRNFITENDFEKMLEQRHQGETNAAKFKF